MRRAFQGIYEGMTVLVTGHTGFKGSWLALWLRELGAHVIGYSLEAPTQPSNFALINLESTITHIHGDIRDRERLNAVVAQYQPQIIFHLAAQAIVLHSYDHPRDTFEVNAMGTIHILEAARFCPSVRAVVIATTDKCYENQEWIWGYRERDPLGGNDPYSASKAMAELAVAAYRKSFFEGKGPAVATARAGNVIGGGDFSAYRIVPDSMKALSEGRPIQVRNPSSIRPWLHVLDPLSGYLCLGARLLDEGAAFAQAWNFGPLEQQGVSVKTLVERAIALWGEGEWVNVSREPAKPEMGLLRLCWDKVAQGLNWRPVYHWEDAIQETVNWFKAYQENAVMEEVCLTHIEDYGIKAKAQGLSWAEDIVIQERKDEVYSYDP